MCPGALDPQDAGVRVIKLAIAWTLSGIAYHPAPSQPDLVPHLCGASPSDVLTLKSGSAPRSTRNLVNDIAWLLPVGTSRPRLGPASGGWTLRVAIITLHAPGRYRSRRLVESRSRALLELEQYTGIPSAGSGPRPVWNSAWL